MIRKLSFTLCLNDEYEGGDFNICETHPVSEKTKVKSFSLKKGEMIVFPSHTCHYDKVLCDYLHANHSDRLFRIWYIVLVQIRIVKNYIIYLLNQCIDVND